MNFQELIAEVLEQIQGSWRYRWWAVCATWLVCVFGWIYVYMIPDVYQASARVYVDTNSLLKPLMQGLTAQQNTMNEVQLVSTAVLTRPNLEKVARTTDLDLRTNSQEQFEDLITLLQTSIRVSGGRDNIFTIQYEDVSREKARDVVAAVLDTFVEDAIEGQSDDAEITGRALAGEIQDHEQRLSAAEDQLAQFKKENLGYMPGESGDYYARLQTALSAVAKTQAQISQLEQRRDELRRQIDGEEPVFGIMPGATSGGGACAERGRISELQGQLAKLLVDFTDKHPRVVALNEQIAILQERCAASIASAPVAATFGDGDKLELNPVYQNLRVQLSNTDVQLVEARGQLSTSENAVAGLRRDVDKIAEVETQLKQLNRDYSVVQTRHQELLKRWEDLQAKKRLDPVTDNVQYRRIEPPFALAAPVAPNRPLFLAAVFVLALVVGGAIAFGMSLLYPVYFSRRSVRKFTGLPVLGAVSMLVEPHVARRSRNAAIAWVGSYCLLVAITVVVIGFGSRASELVRDVVERMSA
jgi:polysaccharide chain length determinant protein (PEP-CTERM system associated)